MNGKLKIGWAARDVSTEKPVNIPGQFHMRISRGVSDPLMANVLILDNGGDIAIFVSVDLVVIRSHLLDEVREKTAELNPEIPVEKIIMNATHTHTGASHYADPRNENSPTSVPYDGVEVASSDEYRDFLSTQTAEAICEAYAGRSCGGIAYGYGYAVVSHSRRVNYFDDTSKRPGSVATGYMVNGHGVMYGNTNDDNFSCYEAGADHFINILYTFNGEGKLTGAVINVPCPSQNSESERMLSADYWNDVRVAIRKQYGDIFIVSQCAAAGDLSPRILHYKKAQERRFRLKYGEMQTERAARKDIAERITNAFTEVLEWAKNDIKTELAVKHVVKTIGLTKRRISDDELDFCQKSLEALKDVPFKKSGDPVADLDYNSSLAAQRNRFNRVIERYNEQDAEPKLPMELHVVRIGDIAFATNRFELYMDFMHRIQARSPFEQTFVVQLTGQPGVEGGSYLATTRGAANKGYSACLFCNLVSPEGGQELVEETVKILKEIHTEE